VRLGWLHSAATGCCSLAQQPAQAGFALSVDAVSTASMAAAVSTATHPWFHKLSGGMKNTTTKITLLSGHITTPSLLYWFHSDKTIRGATEKSFRLFPYE
jgi:hypothetical protein